MTCKFKKITALFFCLLILISSLVLSAFPASAAYENTYRNTGDQAKDIVAVAKTQIGYIEGANNYTKYGEWYGFCDEWCAMFVSWCANQADVSTSAIPKFAGCTTGMGWFKDHGSFKYSAAYGSSYTPKAGDLVFFGTSSTYSYHVGIVENVSGSTLTTIEGNTYGNASNYQDAVLRCTYSTNSSSIVGYATPKYSGASSGGDSNSDIITPPKPTAGEIWIIDSDDGVYLRNGAGTNYDKIGGIPYRGKITVTKKVNADGYNWGYTTYNNVSGWCVLNYATYLSGSISSGGGSGNSVIGDVNGNGKVESIDALLLQKHIATYIKLTSAQLVRADANKDGKVNLVDTDTIQRMVAR